MEKIIDLRSDTVTRPTPQMREAMQAAVVGDDILRDDPTVMELERLAAAMLDKEEALFTVSGTMSNEIAVMVYTKPGEEIIAFDHSHIYNLETGAVAAISGVQVRPLASDNGIYDLRLLGEAISPGSVQRAKTGLICLENSFHLNRGLAIGRRDYGQTIRIAGEHNIPLFMDGARIFNAAAALGVEVKELVDFCDSVAFCLSKGLAAPVGSILAGRKDFIREARRVKQRLGGGWRQAGVIAAPAIVALKEMVQRLPEDHQKAEFLRQGLEALGFRTDRDGVLTNIVYADLSPLGMAADILAERLNRQGIRIKVCSPATIRLVTHNDIDSDDLKAALAQIREAVAN